MNANFKSIATAIAGFAPTLATALGGPLAGGAVSMIASALGLAPDAKPDDVSAAMKAGMTPEQIVAMQTSDNQFKLDMEQKKIDLQSLNDKHEEAFNAAVVDDVKSARTTAIGNDKVYDTGLFILGSFLIAMMLVLWGCWSLISGAYTIKPEMAGMFAAVTGLVGAIVGYFASNAQTVVNFLFGGSLGGRKNADALQDSVQSMGTALGKAANSP